MFKIIKTEKEISKKNRNYYFRTKNKTMNKWGFMAMICLTIWACGTNTSEDKNTSDTSTGDSTGETIDAIALYRKTCAICHGANGKLKLNGAKNFTESTLNLQERILVITNGRLDKGMASFKMTFSEKEIEALAAHTIKLSNAK